MNYNYDTSAGPLEQARVLEQVHAAVLAGDRVPHEPRSVVLDSWRRSLAARINPDLKEPPRAFESGRLNDVRQAHPLAEWIPLLRRNLLEAADETTHILIVTDVDGNILWRQGHPQVCRDADRVQLAEGTRWAESAIGTNAMGTTLATGAPLQIHSAEHLVRTYHSWTCAACPVRDPETGMLLGAIDLSGPVHTMHPALLALVITSARLVESELRLCMNVQDNAFLERYAHHLARLGGQPGALLSRSGRVVVGMPGTGLATGARIALEDVEGTVALTNGEQAELEPLSGGYLLRVRRRRSQPCSQRRLFLKLLGDGNPTATVDGVTHELSLRHAEILTLLALHPGGLSAERLALLLHGERGNPATVRVEVHRIRNVVGHEVVKTRPYRITVDTESDLHTVHDALRRGDVDTVGKHHAGLLLPRSESPAIRDERDELSASLRHMLLSSGDSENLWRFACTEVGRDDLEVLEKLRELMPCDAPQRSRVEARLRRLLEEEA